MKIALFDVSHWHFPLYIPALQDAGVEVVGVSDSANVAGSAVADRFDCPLYASSEELLDQAFDFALVLSRHSAMAALAERLIARRIPFLIEKPCGLNLREVSQLRQLAEEAGVYVSVPFIMRVSDLAVRLSPEHGFTGEGYQHLSFRFIVGPISRYEGNGCGWMLDGRQAGGGSMMNVGVHFIDLISSLTGSCIESVSAQVQTFRPDVTVEEFATFACRTSAGQTGVLETGYLYPSTPDDQREFTFSLSHAAAYLRGYADQLEIKLRDDNRRTIATVEYNTDVYYPDFLRRSWADLDLGRAPVAGLRDAEHAIAVVEAGYRSAANGGAPERVEVAA